MKRSCVGDIISSGNCKHVVRACNHTSVGTIITTDDWLQFQLESVQLITEATPNTIEFLKLSKDF